MEITLVATECRREGCGNPVEQVLGGHRQREYCSGSCKQIEYRRRARAKRLVLVQARLREYLGSDLLPETLAQLETMLLRFGEEAAEDVAAMIASEVKERLAEAERALSRYRQVIDLDADICPWTMLTVVQEFLREHDDETVPFRRHSKTIQVGTIDNHAHAVSEHHGLLRLNDEEVQQCHLYVMKKLGRPVIATVQYEEDDMGDSEPREAGTQSELQRAQAHITELEQQLASYRQICVHSDRTRLQRQFLGIGEQIGYRRLVPAGDDVAVGQGLESWRA